MGRIARSRWLHLALLAVAAGALVQPELNSFDELDVFIQAEALAEHGTLFLDDYADRMPAATRRPPGTHGHVYSKYGIGYPLLAASSMKLAGSAGEFRSERNIRAFKWPNAFLFLLSGYVFYLLLERRIGVGLPSILVALAYLSSTQATFYASAWCTNLAPMAFLTFALYFFESSVETGASPATGAPARLALCGVCIGLAGLCRTFPFVTAVPFAVALLVRSRFEFRRAATPAASLLAPVALFVLVQFTVNYVKVGTLSLGYHPADSIAALTVPFHIGFLGTLLWPGKSFLFFYPVTLLCPLGLHALWRRSRSAAVLCVLAIVPFVVTYSKYHAWWSGPDLGNRYWLPALPFMLYPLAFLKRKLSIALLAALLLFGSYTQLRLFGHRPVPIYRCIYRHFPYPENTRTVQVTLAHDPWSPIRATFIERTLYRCIP